MRFEEVAARLGRLPDPLPRSPAALDPVVIAGRGGRPPRFPATPPMRDAAGLVLLFPDTAGEAHLVLIRRPAGDYRHAGEVSLPGGALEPGDADLEAAALREASEEVGLDPTAAGLRLMGRLGPVEVRVSGFRLVPVLALAERAPRLRPDAREVAAILEPPVDLFLPAAPIEIVEADRGGWRLRYGAYPAEGLFVWGATARVLGQLGAVLRRSPLT
ncbi:MAG TPA: CoA pyrophosphatase [Candidatus Limnocylindrales bacterium]|nr:CoA pyrophosphatase [Candidatus Limnocylindrales bacterium]